MREFARRTVADPVKFQGIGLHRAAPVTVTIHPGEEGVAIRRAGRRTPAKPENVEGVDRCTCLGGVAVVEHVLSALAGLGITDAEVEVDGDEMPALDGGAAELCAGLLSLGTRALGSAWVGGPFARVFHVEEAAEVAIAKGDGHWRFEYDLGERWPGLQVFELYLTPETYAQEVAPARTIALMDEVEAVRARGLGHGVDETQVIVLDRDGYYNAPKFPDEPARHKLLDLIGDLSLAGVPVGLLSVVGQRSGHRANVAAAAKLAASVTFSNEPA